MGDEQCWGKISSALLYFLINYAPPDHVPMIHRVEKGKSTFELSKYVVCAALGCPQKLKDEIGYPHGIGCVNFSEKLNFVPQLLSFGFNFVPRLSWRSTLMLTIRVRMYLDAY